MLLSVFPSLCLSVGPPLCICMLFIDLLSVSTWCACCNKQTLGASVDLPKERLSLSLICLVIVPSFWTSTGWNIPIFTRFDQILIDSLYAYFLVLQIAFTFLQACLCFRVSLCGCLCSSTFVYVLLFIRVMGWVAWLQCFQLVFSSLFPFHGFLSFLIMQVLHLFLVFCSSVLPFVSSLLRSFAHSFIS